jgi:hypothetical protein
VGSVRIIVKVNDGEEIPAMLSGAVEAWRARNLLKGYTEVSSPRIEPAPPGPETYVVTKYRA